MPASKLDTEEKIVAIHNYYNKLRTLACICKHMHADACRHQKVSNIGTKLHPTVSKLYPNCIRFGYKLTNKRES